MAKKKGKREYVWLECKECGQRNYRTGISVAEGTPKIELKKYCKSERIRTAHKIKRLRDSDNIMKPESVEIYCCWVNLRCFLEFTENQITIFDCEDLEPEIIAENEEYDRQELLQLQLKAEEIEEED